MKKYVCLLSISFSLLLVACKKDSAAADTKAIDNTIKKRFNVYGFIVYSGYMQNGIKVNRNAPVTLEQYLATFGIQKVNLLYEPKLLDYPNGDQANALPNITRIDSLAKQALNDPKTLVSLDMESWNRYNTTKAPTTPDRFIEVINEFKKINPQSPLGLYATVSQNTYGYSAATASTYNPLNLKYAGVAAVVDYFSPSLYNYNGVDAEAWKNAAVYNVGACKAYNFPTKPIVPYITPRVTDNGVDRFLSYDEMTTKLQTLYDAGANGCIIWTSSSTRNADGSYVYVDVTTGWAKAIVDFIASHQ